MGVVSVSLGLRLVAVGRAYDAEAHLHEEVALALLVDEAGEADGAAGTGLVEDLDRAAEARGLEVGRDGAGRLVVARAGRVRDHDAQAARLLCRGAAAGAGGGAVVGLAHATGAEGEGGGRGDGGGASQGGHSHGGLLCRGVRDGARWGASQATVSPRGPPVTVAGTDVVEFFVLTVMRAPAAATGTIRGWSDDGRGRCGLRCAASGRRPWPAACSPPRLLIVSIVFVGVGALSVAQQGAGVTDREVRRARQVAEQVTQEPGVRQVLGPQGEAWMSQAQAALESGRTLSDSAGVYLARADGTVVASAADQPLRRVPRTEAFDGRSFLGGDGDDADASTVMAMAPVIVPGSLEPAGVVAVTRPSHSVWDDLAAITPNLLTYLGLAGLIGVVGSLLLARRVKRQTLGLEPREIAGLVEQREAVLHGIKEGLLAVDLTGRVTLINDEAATLLSIPQAGAVGHSLSEARRRPAAPRALPATGRAAQRTDRHRDGRAGGLLGRPGPARARTPRHRQRHAGSSAGPPRRTRRDAARPHRACSSLQRDLDVTRATTDSLRAQAHEFSNRMHVVAGLIALEEYADVTDYIRHITADEAEPHRKSGHRRGRPRRRGHAHGEVASGGRARDRARPRR